MESKPQVETKSEQTEKLEKISSEKPGMITPVTAQSQSEGDWQEYVELVIDYVAQLPELVTNFFSSYQKPLTTTGLIIVAAITVYITIAVLDAIEHIPLLSPILELVGLGYSVWFVWRYLLKASTRQELWAEIESFKKQVVGDKND
ncbi:MAG: hypothetical protein NZ901_08680 [Geminocystis sp.]|nr:hypothetical protein [Geminocystis sp.]HIK37295.1 hypothetical protein [Geminocystis sp. M7585_C2015_104]MCS7148250.1 hypothetical protein [Geminocystis sp.]MCX8077665.1 hypothetical protein [Geminocystis sp.]MDW8116557.1 CAAD domain-containing protein [Geminocystis sp.]